MNLKMEPLALDGLRFETTQYAAMRSLTLLARLAKSVGPALAAVKSSDLSTDFGVIAGALAQLEPAEAASLTCELLAGTVAVLSDGARVSLLDQRAIDRIFTGRLMTLFRVLAHAIKVNYADFGLGSPSAPSE